MRRIATLAFAFASLASPLAAQSHPDFSGKWVLDTKASEGPMMPTAMTIVVTQDAKTLKVDNTSSIGEQKTTNSLTYNLDGTPAKNTLSNMGQSVELTSTSKWEGPMLVVSTQADLGSGRMLSQTDHWSFSPDHKTLLLTRDVNVSGQTMAIKMTFVKP